jgi:signal transduction histidine kinase
MSTLIKEVVMEFEQSARIKEVELILAFLAGELPVRGDSLALKQAVTNLVENAIRYNNSGGKVEVSARKKGDSLVIEVKDDGPGIPREEQGKIFDRFYRVDKSRSRKQGGSGLGLAIVKEIVSGHGGSIAVSGDTGQGSTFTISLPLASSR